jgi:hypothetical protein
MEFAQGLSQEKLGNESGQLALQLPAPVDGGVPPIQDTHMHIRELVQDL